MTVDDYINQQTPEQQRILRRLRQLMLTADAEVREKIGWNVPVYTYRKQLICYLNVLKTPKPSVDLAFMKGYQLPDEAGLLETRNRKRIRSLVVVTVSDWDEDLIRTYIQEALWLSQERSI